MDINEKDVLCRFETGGSNISETEGGNMDTGKIDRINELYHKSQSVGLSDEEKAEQAALRKDYIETIRRNMRANLNSISIQEKDGTVTDLGKKYGGVQDE